MESMANFQGNSEATEYHERRQHEQESNSTEIALLLSFFSSGMKESDGIKSVGDLPSGPSSRTLTQKDYIKMRGNGRIKESKE